MQEIFILSQKLEPLLNCFGFSNYVFIQHQITFIAKLFQISINKNENVSTDDCKRKRKGTEKEF